MEGSCCNNGEFKSIVGRQRIKVANIQKSEGSIIKNSQRLDGKKQKLKDILLGTVRRAILTQWRALSSMYLIILEQ